MLSAYDVDDARAEESQARSRVQSAEAALRQFAESGSADLRLLERLNAELDDAKLCLQGARGRRIGYESAIRVG